MSFKRGDFNPPAAGSRSAEGDKASLLNIMLAATAARFPLWPETPKFSISPELAGLVKVNSPVLNAIEHD